MNVLGRNLNSFVKDLILHVNIAVTFVILSTLVSSLIFTFQVLVILFSFQAICVLKVCELLQLNLEPSLFKILLQALKYEMISTL